MDIIDITNGNFHLSDEIIIHKESHYSEIIELVPIKDTWDVENGYKWIYLNHFKIGKLFFYIGLCFYNERLFCIDFSFNNYKRENLTWDDWDEKDELKKKRIYDQWLTQMIGDKRDFEWGKVDAYYNPRVGVSSIFIKYHQPDLF